MTAATIALKILDASGSGTFGNVEKALQWVADHQAQYNIVAVHKLDVNDLRPDHFILVQRWLDALREIQDTLGYEKVRCVGRTIIEAGHFPPQFTDAESILLALDEIYYLNHRGNVGHYFAKRLSDGSIVVRCETPYPRTFEYGLIDGICRHPRIGGGFIVQYDPGPIAGHVTCTLRVRRV